MITYSVIKKKDPRDANAEASYHACAVSNGTATLRSIAEKISEKCTLTTVDTFAVLEALVSLIPQELAEGRIVQLGEFGSFRVTLRSEGVETADKLTKSAIKDVKVNFRQGSEFRKKMSSLSFEKRA